MNAISNRLNRWQRVFSDIPEAISNTLEVAEKCKVEIDFKTKHYPVYLPPSLDGKTYTKEEQAKAVEEYLWQLCEEGIPRRYTPETVGKSSGTVSWQRSDAGRPGTA